MKIEYTQIIKLTINYLWWTIDMKCLSLKQPYAELLVSGKKTIELKNWNTLQREILDTCFKKCR
jgi:ASCH domain-containing protein